MSFKLGFYLLVESGVTTEELTEALHRMKCFTVKDIQFQDGKGYRKASVSVDRWFDNRWSKEIQSNLEVGSGFYVYSNYGYNWIARTQRVYENGEVKDDCGKHGPWYSDWYLKEKEKEKEKENNSLPVSEK